MRLVGRRILLTGGTSGIGRALLIRLGEQGNRIVTCGRDPGRVEETRGVCPGAEVVETDLMAPGAARKLVEMTVDHLGGLDILINNAGISGPLELSDPDLAAAGASEMIAINLTSVVHLTLHALPHLLRSPEAAVINVTSVVAYIPKGRAPVYAATKAGLRAFTTGLRSRLAGTGVAVIELVPALVDTPMAAGINRPKMSPDSFALRAIAAIESGRKEIRIGRNRAIVQLQRISPRLADRLIH